MAGGGKEKFQGPLMGRRAICEGLVSLLVAGATLAAPKALRAQAKYPERPVRIIVPFGAGGVADITTRLVGEKLGDKLGQRFVVENVPGAGGIQAALQLVVARIRGMARPTHVPYACSIAAGTVAAFFLGGHLP